ncbi:MAG: hypothetical protein PHS19_02245 [Eubacteriales bacterium]|nr:hypothetical protein [Eubacteriales bacterium]
MNYGKKFLHIIMAAAGMMICIMGIAYKTGYFPGHSNASAILLIVAGAVITVFGLLRTKDD